VFLQGLLDLFLPRVCVLCEALLAEARGLACSACWARVVPLPCPLCDRCGHPTGGAACRWCALLPAFVAFARSACWVPEGAGGALVHKLKYDGWTRVADDLAERMAALRRPEASGARLVLVPVPLGAARFRERGYNQSELLARGLARRWHTPIAVRAITRARETRSQVLLTPDERSANVHGAFTVGSAADEVRGTHVVLVDDVVTTAATLNACGAALMAAGARMISYFTFGRARAAFDRTTHPRKSRSETRWLSASASTGLAASAARSSAPRKSGERPTSTSSRSTT
jgi:ComF family protein